MCYSNAKAFCFLILSVIKYFAPENGGGLMPPAPLSLQLCSIMTLPNKFEVVKL